MSDIRGRVENIVGMAELIADHDEFMQFVLDLLPWGILVVDKKMQIVFINKRFEEMSGWESQDLLYRPLKTVIPTGQRKKHHLFEKEYVKEPYLRIGHPSLQLLRKDKKRIEVEITLSPGYFDGELFVTASLRPTETLKEKNVVPIGSSEG